MTTTSLLHWYVPLLSEASNSHLAAAIRSRRMQFLDMTIEQAAELAGLSEDQWTALESGWLPPEDSSRCIWCTLAATLQIDVDALFLLESTDLLHRNYRSLGSQPDTPAATL
jgi:hypothetical protein